MLRWRTIFNAFTMFVSLWENTACDRKLSYCISQSFNSPNRSSIYIRLASFCSKKTQILWLLISNLNLLYATRLQQSGINKLMYCLKHWHWKVSYTLYKLSDICGQFCIHSPHSNHCRIYILKGSSIVWEH